LLERFDLAAAQPPYEPIPGLGGAGLLLGIEHWSDCVPEDGDVETVPRSMAADLSSRPGEDCRLIDPRRGGVVLAGASQPTIILARRLLKRSENHGAFAGI